MERFTPGLSVDVPDGWAAGGSIELASPELDVRVIASSERVPPELSVEQYAEWYGRALAAGMKQYEEHSVDTEEADGGQTVLIRHFSWIGGDGERVSQLQLYSVAGGRGLVATASAAPTTFGDAEPRLRKVLLGITLAGDVPRSSVLNAGSDVRSRTYEALEHGRLATSRAKAFGVPEGTSAGAAPDAWQAPREQWRAVREAR